MPSINLMKKQAETLLALLSDPQPSLISWVYAVDAVVAELHAECFQTQDKTIGTDGSHG